MLHFVRLKRGAGIKGVLSTEAQRVKLTDAQGAWSPQLSFNLGYHNAQTDSFETESSELNCAQLEIEAKKIELLDGVKGSGQNSTYTGEELTITGAKSGATSNNVGVGVSVSVGPAGVGLSGQGTGGQSSETNPYQC